MFPITQLGKYSLFEVAEVTEKSLNVAGYVSIPGVCQTAAAMRSVLAVSLIVGGLAGACYFKGSMWGRKIGEEIKEFLSLIPRLKENVPPLQDPEYLENLDREDQAKLSISLKWCGHGFLNVPRALIEYFNIFSFGSIFLGAWDNFSWRISHLSDDSPFGIAEDRINKVVKFLLEGERRLFSMTETALKDPPPYQTV